MPSPLNLRSRLSTVMALRVDSPAPTAAPAPLPTAPVARQDASPNALGSTQSGSAMSNALSGMGLPSDSASTTRPNIGRAYLADEELVALLRGTIYRRIVEIYPREATREGWDILDDTDEPRPLHDMQRDLNVPLVFMRADTWARTFGESRVWMITEDASELSEPLDPSTVTALKALQVFDKTELSPASYTCDIESPNFGRPEKFWITPRRVGIAVNNGKPIHYTRLLRFFGEPLPPSRAGTAGQTWGDADAIGQTLWDAIRHLGDVGAGGAKLAQELTMAVFHFANAAGATAGSDRSAWLSKLSTIVQMKSNWQAVFLGVQDKFERLGSNASGFKDLSEHAKAELAMLTEIPVELLYGQAPGGFTSDGSSWQANWHARVGAYQAEHIRPPLEQLVEVMYYADRGAVPDDWAVKFRPLAKLTPMELADLRLKTTQADQIAMLDGILTPERIARSRYADGEFQLEIQPLTPEEEAEQDRERAGESDPALVAEAEAALLAARGEVSPTRGDAEPEGFRAQRFKVPAGARGNARKVLGWREEHGGDVRGMTATGWRRARQLAEDDTISGQDMVEIAAWGARHAANADLSAEHKDEPWRDAGYVSWLGWGGDSMINHATDVVERNRDD